PHLGWSTIRPAQNSTIFKGLEAERFYFAHSYAVLEWNFDQGIEVMEPPQVSWSNHGGDFIAAVENGPLTGVQFHPELSGPAGLQLLNNWLGSVYCLGGQHYYWHWAVSYWVAPGHYTDKKRQSGFALLLSFLPSLQ